MSKSVSDRCMMGLKGLEDQIRESTTIEALNTYMNSNIFMCSNNTPNNIEDLILMDTILGYLKSHKDENIKRNVFNIMFMQKSDPRKIDFLVKLASLALTTLSSSALDIFGYWMKNSAPKSLLSILIKRLLVDVLSVDINRIDLLKLLPESSISFTAVFVIGITDLFNFIGPNYDPPCLTVLRHILEWVSKYKQQLFNTESLGLMTQTSQNYNQGNDEYSKNTTPFPGLLFWTLSQPLSKMDSVENCNITTKFPMKPKAPSQIEEENQLISSLHFELLNYLDERIRGSSNYLLSTEYLRYIIETINKYRNHKSPNSLKKKMESKPKIPTAPMHMDENLNVVLIRLSEVIQIGLRNDSFQCSRSEIEFLLRQIAGHEYIDSVLSSFD